MHDTRDVNDNLSSMDSECKNLHLNRSPLCLIKIKIELLFGKHIAYRWVLYHFLWLLYSDVSASFLSRQSHKPFESESSQSHLNFFRVESESDSWLGRVISSHWFPSSSQCRVTRNLTFFLHFFAMKWHPTCYKMEPDKLENGSQCCFNKFDCRLFISKFSQFAFYLSLSHSVISKSLAQPFCKCCSLSVSIVLNVRFTTNGMCVMNNTRVARASRNKISTTWTFIVACCHSGKVCALAALPFQSQQSDALTRMWIWCHVKTSQKERAIGAAC